VHLEAGDSNGASPDTSKSRNAAASLLQAVLIASANPSNLTISVDNGQGGKAGARVCVTCKATGHANLLIKVTRASGAASELYSDVLKSIEVVCRPGILVAFKDVLSSATPTPSYVSSLVRLQPRQELVLYIALDTAPTAKTELHILNSAPSLVQKPSSIIFPPFTTSPRMLKIQNLKGSAGDSILKIRPALECWNK
jgi:hypothetical protein